MIKFSADTRQKVLENLHGQLFDIVIIGGGITGAGVAMAAAKKGYKTLLLEKKDFASGTSSRSSKMIHGGLRYLQQMNIGLVKESLSEREILMQIAPHQVYPQEYVYPVYEFSQNNKFEVKIGLIGYDLLAGSQQIGHHRMLSAQKLSALEPEINPDQLTGAFIYYDCLVDDGRLTLASVQTAKYYGAKILNYFKVNTISGSFNSMEVEGVDQMSGKTFSVKTKVLVNATGPWTDNTRNYLQPSESLLRPTKGIHIVFDKKRLPLQRSVVIFSEDGRMIFTVPKGKYTYVGTTDTDYKGNLDEIYANDEDINYLLKAANQSFHRAKLTKKDIISTWAGLRPLIGSEGDPSDVSRDFEIVSDTSRFYTVAGGKLTTYRLMGEKTIRKIEKALPSEFNSVDNTRSDLAVAPLIGGNIRDITQYREFNKLIYSELWKLRPETIDRLITMYGTQFQLLGKYGSSRLTYITKDSDYLFAELDYILENEMVLTLEDIMWRRLSLLIFDALNGTDIVQIIADEMAKILNWDDKKKAEELVKYSNLVIANNGIAAGIRLDE